MQTSGSRSVAVLALFFGQGLNILISFLFLPYLSRSLTLSEYGTYGQVTMVSDFIKLIFAIGLSKIIFYFYSKYESEASSVFSTNILASFILGVLGCVVTVLFAPVISLVFKSELVISLLLLSSLSLPFQIVSQTLNATLIYFKRIQSSVIISVVSNLVRSVLLFSAIYFSNRLDFLFLALLIASIFECVLYLLYLPGNIKIQKNINWRLTWEQIEKGLPIMFTSVLGIAFTYTGGFLISSMLNVEEYAIYRNGTVEVPLVGSLYSAIGTILLPDLARYFNEHKYDEIVQLKRKAISLTSILIIPVVVFILFFSKELIVVYLSEKYTLSSDIFMIYSLILLIRVNNYQDLFIAAAKGPMMSRIFLFVFFANIPVAYFLILKWGIKGAAISAVFGIFLLAITLLHFGAKQIKKSIIDFIDYQLLSKIVLISCIVVIVIKGIVRYMEINNNFVLLFLGLYLIICLHISLKLHYFDPKILSTIFDKNRFTASISSYIKKIYL